jgi:hypothetical protein
VQATHAAAWLPALWPHSERAQQTAETIAAAEQFNSRYGVLASSAMAVMPNQVPPYVQQNLLVEALAMEGAALPGFQSLMAMCRPALFTGGAAPAPAPVPAPCTAVAHLLVERSVTLRGHQIGSNIGEWGGWPKAQEEARRAQASAKLSSIAFFDQPMSCATVEAARGWVREVATKGEMATLRERAAAKLKK